MSQHCTVEYAKKKLASLGELHQSGQEFWVEYGPYTVSFLRNGIGETATCFHTKRSSEQSDLLSDYFPGSFWPNLTRAIRFVKKYTQKVE